MPLLTSDLRMPSHAKINLGLYVLGKRPDGYHDIWTIFQELEFHDVLYFTKRDAPLTLTTNHPTLPVGDENLICRAARAFAQKTGCPTQLAIHLEKQIPLGAGLGGGSSDAAALLQWLNKRLPAPLTDEELATVALKVGADTPFFLKNTPCRVRGIGEIIEPCGPDELAGIRLVLVCSNIHASTPQAYADYDAAMQASNTIPGQNCLTKPASKANGTFLSGVRIVLDLHNDLEAVVFSRHPQLAEIKANLLRLGACAVAMSGSGSSIVALFARESHVESQAAAAMLQGENRRVYAHVL